MITTGDLEAINRIMRVRSPHGCQRLSAALRGTGRYIAEMCAWAGELSDAPQASGTPIPAEDQEMIVFGSNVPPGTVWAL